MEPLEGFNGTSNPDELHPLQSLGRVRACADIVDVLEYARPGRDADACAYENSDLVVEDIFCGSTVGSVNAKSGHGLPVLQGDFVDPVVVVMLEVTGLAGATA